MPSPRETAKGFQDEYRFLSNFYPAVIQLQGIVYHSSEHAYQAYKTVDISKRLHIASLATPGQAKRYWKNKFGEVRYDWDDIKLKVMALVVLAKFRQNPELARMLLHTDNMALIEYNIFHDMFWGVCKCPKHRNQGQNMLGLILGNVRTLLRKEVDNDTATN
jgi:ribA/ribD-fused uncharacterized protein